MKNVGNSKYLCKDCGYVAEYVPCAGCYICMNENSTNDGKVMFKKTVVCRDFKISTSRFKAKDIKKVNYFWCKTCGITVYPCEKIEKHKDHSIYLDKDLKHIQEIAELIMTAGD